MATIMEKLHIDHKNLGKLLGFLTNTLRQLENYEECDLKSLSDALRYMKNYPDCIHHPLENEVFIYYKDHHNDIIPQIENLLHEHDTLPPLTERLATIVDSALAGDPQSRDVLCHTLRDYIDIQNEHMNLEESMVYPKINTVLDEQEWNKINTELALREDPLFGQQVEQSYKALLHRIFT